MERTVRAVSGCGLAPRSSLKSIIVAVPCAMNSNHQFWISWDLVSRNSEVAFVSVVHVVLSLLQSPHVLVLVVK